MGRATTSARGLNLIGSIACLLAVALPGGPTGSTGGAALGAADPVTAALVPIGPVRLADTRDQRCGCERSSPPTITVDVGGRADVPDDAVAAVVTITALRTSTPGYVTAHPTGGPRPGTSTVNTRTDRVVANTTIVPLGADGRLAVYSSQPGHVVVDLTAVFVPAPRARAGRYVPTHGERLVDTREGTPRGVLAPNGELTVPLPSGVGPDATAVVVNVTHLGETRPGFVTARPAGSPPVATSFLNPNGAGAPLAAATVVPVSRRGLTIRSTSGGHVVVDLLGWFTGPGSAESGAGLYVPAPPRRVLDTRAGAERIHAGGTLEVPSPFPAAGALVTNVTAVRPDRRGFVTAHPAGRPVPATSTVNPAAWNDTVANFAITPISVRGTAYRSYAGTDLLVDVTGWFTGTPVAADRPVPPNDPGRSRVLIVGDSTLASLGVVTQARAAFVGFDAVVDAASCRRLLRPSCLSNVTGLIPNTAVEAIAGAPGRFDVVVVKAGYNDWFSDFPTEFDAVVRTARAKGAHTVLWMSYNEDVDRTNARRAYVENNVDLRRLVTRPEYSDVVLADWLAYSRGRPDWFVDGTHLGVDGTWSLADYISRWVAALEHRPCPRPWAVGLATPDPCPAPDGVGPVPDARALY